MNSSVSVIIPFHNDNLTIKRAVNSAIHQTYEVSEIIIVDSGSDKPLRLADFNLEENKRIKLISFSETKNPAEARNIGVRAASGKYIAFLDADDYWGRDKIRKQLIIMNKLRINDRPPILTFTGRFLFENASGNTYIKKYVSCNNVVGYKRLLKTNQISCSSVLLERKTVLEHPFTENVKNLHEDYALWLELLKKGGYAAGINEPLLYYQVSRTSMSGKKIKSAYMTYVVYRNAGFSFSECIFLMLSYIYRGFCKYYIR